MGRTEAINNHKNPDFVTLINVNYYFERRQVIMFRVEDQDEGNKTELIGTCDSELGALL